MGQFRYAGAAWTARRYAAELRWPVRTLSGQAMLTLDQHMAAVTVPAEQGPRTGQRLHRLGTVGPVLSLREPTPCWLFLADPNGVLLLGQRVPDGVTVTGCPAHIPLPSVTNADTVEWILPPDPRRRWLPTVSAVLAAVTG